METISSIIGKYIFSIAVFILNTFWLLYIKMQAQYDLKYVYQSLPKALNWTGVVIELFYVNITLLKCLIIIVEQEVFWP